MGIFALSEPAHAFLLGTIRHLNTIKKLPDDQSGQALQTSSWLEEIEAALTTEMAAVDLSEAERRWTITNVDGGPLIVRQADGSAPRLLVGESVEVWQ